MKIVFHKGLFVCRPPKEFVQPLLQARWAYHKPTNTWRTSQARRVIPFYEHCAPQAKERVGKLIKKKQEAIKPSVMEELDLDFDIPHNDGIDYKPFQYAGVHFMHQRPVTLLGDPPGLGKTIQAIGLANLDKATRVLIICPASLKEMWVKMWKVWTTLGLSVGVVYGDEYPDTEVVIINYELVDRHSDIIQNTEWSHLFIDEAHYLMTPEAQRTKAIYGDTSRHSSWRTRQKNPGIKADRVVAMTGTPVMKCPHNLWPFLARFDPDGLGKNYYAFITRYCDWRRGDKLPPTGGSNLDELQEYLRTKFMIRRSKTSVLKELPPKTRQIIELPSKGLKKLIDAEINAVHTALGELEDLIDSTYQMEFDEEAANENDYQELIDTMREVRGVTYEEQAGNLVAALPTPFEDMARARKELALAKLPMCIEFIKNVMDGAEDKTIVFCYHKDVAKALAEAFPKCAMITGLTPVKKRQGIVEQFQEDPEVNPFIGNIQAAGVGYTLTAATNVIFVELTWIPPHLDQAEDRAWRIGQLNAVNIWHLVVEGSMDARMVEKLVERQQMISETIDITENSVLAIEVD